MMKKTFAALGAVLLLTPAAAFAQDQMAPETPAAQGAPAPAVPDAPAAQDPAQDGAPEAAQDGGDWLQYKNPYAGEQNDISNPHRTAEEITALGMQLVADGLSYRPGAFSAHAQELKVHFVAKGWAEYAAYLQSSKLLDVIRKPEYAISAASDGDPIMLNNGVIDGAYHWLVEVPVIVSITQRDPEGADQIVSTGKMKIRVLLARVAQGGGDDGIVIESWQSATPAAQ